MTVEAWTAVAAQNAESERLRMGYVGRQTRKHTVKAVGYGEHQGIVLYGKKAREALEAQRKLPTVAQAR